MKQVGWGDMKDWWSLRQTGTSHLKRQPQLSLIHVWVKAHGCQVPQLSQRSWKSGFNVISWRYVCLERHCRPAQGMFVGQWVATSVSNPGCLWAPSAEGLSRPAPGISLDSSSHMGLASTPHALFISRLTSRSSSGLERILKKRKRRKP